MNNYFLNYAAELASKIDPHKVSPNPRVGCVIVCNNKIIASGVHKTFGGLHAEVNALSSVSSVFGSNYEIYITLEPCDNFSGKKTPSCTQLLINNKPKKIIIGALDPYFKGKNLEKLQQAGIETELQKNKKCQALNPFFAKYCKTTLPYLTIKMAQSLDGKTTSTKKYITNEKSRQVVHKMRSQYSAILTTVKTILDDNPLLNCRISTLESELNCKTNKTSKNSNSNPSLIILGNKNKVPKHAKIFDNSDRKIYWFDTHDLTSVLKQCGKMGIDSIMTECGTTVATELLKQNLVDEISLFIAPIILGQGKNTFNIDLSSNFKKFQLTEVQNLNGDIWIKYKNNLLKTEPEI